MSGERPLMTHMRVCDWLDEYVPESMQEPATACLTFLQAVSGHGISSIGTMLGDVGEMQLGGCCRRSSTGCEKTCR